MKILISPAKSLDFENNIETSYSSSPLFADKALEINNTLKELSAPDLRNLMSISPKLSDLNWLRNQDFIVEEVPFAEISKQEGLLRCSTMPLFRD